MKPAKRALAVAALTLVSCSSPVVPASTPTTGAVTLRLYATDATIPLLTDLTTAYSAINPAIAFDIVTGGSRVILDQLADKQDGYGFTTHLPEGGNWLAWPVAQSGIAVIVNPNLAVTGLSSSELRRIYLGHIGNWKEVGGPDAEVVLFSREDGSDTRAEFEQQVMGERLTTLSARLAPSSEAMVISVAEEPGSIGYVAMGYLNEGVRALEIDGAALTPQSVSENRYPLRSTVFAVGLEEPEGDYRAFIGWVQSAEGQAVVGLRHAALLRP